MMRAVYLMALWVSFTGCMKLGSRDERPVVAWVGGTPIYLDDFKRELNRVRLEPDDTGAPSAQSEQAERTALLDDLINRRLLLVEAEKHNVTVPSDAVESAYQKVHSGWKDDEYSALLKEKDVTAAELKAELRDMLVVRKYLRDWVFARVAVTDQEIETYVKSHPESLLGVEEVHARQILVKTADQAASIVQQVARGLPFEDAAMKYSLSPDGESGGDLGFFARGFMPKEFDETCFALRDGEVSRVVPSPYGYHLFKVLERHSAAARTLSMVRDSIESKLRHGKEWTAQSEKVKELRAAAAVQIKEKRLAEVL